MPMACMKHVFRCPDEMRFINMSWVCDGIGDCSSNADERPSLCAPVRTTTLSTDHGFISTDMNIILCSENEFKCASGECIPSGLVCDTVRHCADGSDESINCSNPDSIVIVILNS